MTISNVQNWILFPFVFILVNCAHQLDDDYMRKQLPHPPLVMMPPPQVPPTVVTPPLAPATPKAQIITPSLPKPKVSTKATKSAKTPNVSGLHLNMDSPLSPPVRRLIKTAEDNLKKGKILEARSQADRAYRMDLRDPRTSFLMAKVSASEKDFEGAEQWALRALEKLDDSANQAVVWGLIARVREKNGNKSGAEKAIRKRNEGRR